MLDIYMQITQNIISGQSRDYFIKSLRTQTSSETPGRILSKTARQLDPKHQEKTLKRGRKICLVARKRGKKKRGGLLRGGHFGFHLSPWRRAPGPQKPLGRTNCLRVARYFLQHHLSLSPHNDSPRSSLLMFVIALSHKGG